MQASGIASTNSTAHDADGLVVGSSYQQAELERVLPTYPPPSSATRRVARRQRQLPILEHEPNLIAIIIACCTKISI